MNRSMGLISVFGVVGVLAIGVVARSRVIHAAGGAMSGSRGYRKTTEEWRRESDARHRMYAEAEAARRAQPDYVAPVLPSVEETMAEVRRIRAENDAKKRG